MLNRFYKGDKKSTLLPENIGGITKAIHDLFPEIGLKEKLLTSIGVRKWQGMEYECKLFIKEPIFIIYYWANFCSILLH